MIWKTMLAVLARVGRRSIIAAPDAFALGNWACAWLSGDAVDTVDADPPVSPHEESDDCVQCLIDRGVLAAEPRRGEIRPDASFDTGLG